MMITSLFLERVLCVLVLSVFLVEAAPYRIMPVHKNSIDYKEGAEKKIDFNCEVQDPHVLPKVQLELREYTSSKIVMVKEMTLIARMTTSTKMHYFQHTIQISELPSGRYTAKVIFRHPANDIVQTLQLGKFNIDKSDYCQKVAMVGSNYTVTVDASSEQTETLEWSFDGAAVVSCSVENMTCTSGNKKYQGSLVMLANGKAQASFKIDTVTRQNQFSILEWKERIGTNVTVKKYGCKLVTHEPYRINVNKDTTGLHFDGASIDFNCEVSDPHVDPKALIELRDYNTKNIVLKKEMLPIRILPGNVWLFRQTAYTTKFHPGKYEANVIFYPDLPSGNPAKDHAQTSQLGVFTLDKRDYCQKIAVVGSSYTVTVDASSEQTETLEWSINGLAVVWCSVENKTCTSQSPFKNTYQGSLVMLADGKAQASFTIVKVTRRNQLKIHEWREKNGTDITLKTDDCKLLTHEPYRIFVNSHTQAITIGDTSIDFKCEVLKPHVHPKGHLELREYNTGKIVLTKEMPIYAEVFTGMLYFKKTVSKSELPPGKYSANVIFYPDLPIGEPAKNHAQTEQLGVFTLGD